MEQFPSHGERHEIDRRITACRRSTSTTASSRAGLRSSSATAPDAPAAPSSGGKVEIRSLSAEGSAQLRVLRTRLLTADRRALRCAARGPERGVGKGGAPAASGRGDRHRSAWRPGATPVRYACFQRACASVRSVSGRRPDRRVALLALSAILLLALQLPRARPRRVRVLSALSAASGWPLCSRCCYSRASGRGLLPRLNARPRRSIPSRGLSPLCRPPDFSRARARSYPSPSSSSRSRPSSLGTAPSLRGGAGHAGLSPGEMVWQARRRRGRARGR